MGPGMAARLARGGLDVVAADVSADAVERARGLLPVCDATLDQLGIDVPADGPGTVRFVGGCRRGRRRRRSGDRERAREGRGQGRPLPGDRAADRAGDDRRVRHLGHSDHHAPGPSRPAAPAGRHALVEPAAHHSDDRGGVGREDRPRCPRRGRRPDPVARPAARGGQEGRAGFRRESGALRGDARGDQPGRPGRDRPGGPGCLRRLGASATS